ncbi:GT1 family glycosyltransferase [Rickettsiales bacterium Ac37b]|nr:GT1 family glycosyltransferase [Rickettsiales bacterium Ac37b]
MLVVNTIFGRRKGDIEQTFIDYTKCLIDLGCNTALLAYKDAPILNVIPKDIPVHTIPNFGQWDPLVGWKLKNAIQEIKPDVIIAHGNRTNSLLNKTITDIPIIGVCHNINLRQAAEHNPLITVSDELRRTLIKKGHNPNYIYTIPHMVYIPTHLTEKNNTWHNPPVIGALGRFVAKKGFTVFLNALNILRNRNIPFKAILGGDGIEMLKLKQLAHELNLENLIEFPGWIEDKNSFFSAIDIFCLPSLHEPVGMVILEAFMHSITVVTSDTDGPMEIVRPHIDALMVEAGDANKLANALEKLIQNPNFATKLAKEGFNNVTTNYESKAIGKKLYNVIEKVISNYNAYNNDISANKENLMSV